MILNNLKNKVYKLLKNICILDKKIIINSKNLNLKKVKQMMIILIELTKKLKFYIKDYLINKILKNKNKLIKLLKNEYLNY